MCSFQSVSESVLSSVCLPSRLVVVALATGLLPLRSAQCCSCGRIFRSPPLWTSWRASSCSCNLSGFADCGRNWPLFWSKQPSHQALWGWREPVARGWSRYKCRQGSRRWRESTDQGLYIEECFYQRVSAAFWFQSHVLSWRNLVDLCTLEAPLCRSPSSRKSSFPCCTLSRAWLLKRKVWGCHLCSGTFWAYHLSICHGVRHWDWLRSRYLLDLVAYKCSPGCHQACNDKMSGEGEKGTYMSPVCKSWIEFLWSIDYISCMGVWKWKRSFFIKLLLYW